MSGPNYNLAFNKLTSSGNDEPYLNSRYAPVGKDDVGIPFYAYKETAGRFTQMSPSSLDMNVLKKKMNLPTDNNTFRQGLMQNAIGIGNEGLQNWTFNTQTLANPSLSTMFCTSNNDCTPFGPSYTCNPNYEPWPDSHGVQTGAVCSYTAYPEIDSGTYNRKDEFSGGIGKSCNSNKDCGEGYECNMNTDIMGRSVQQTGYCAQTYDCGDGKKRFMGYPYNSSVPVPPPAGQNNGGAGYKTEAECRNKALANQHCVNNKGAWFATYPGYCPVQSTLRKGGPQGALSTSNESQIDKGFQIPSYGSFMGSSMGGSTQARSGPLGSLASSSMNDPFKYELSLNPKPSNM